MADKPIQGALSDEEIVSMARLFSTENHYQLGRFTSADFGRDALILFARAIESEVRSAVQEEAARHGDGRTPQDYAIEHAEYMAKSAEQLTNAWNDLAKALQEFEDGQCNESDVDAAQETVGEHLRTVKERIYEFRKRRDRAAAPGVQAALQGADIHSCIPFCERPGCVADREWMEKAERLLQDCGPIWDTSMLLAHIRNRPASPSLQAGDAPCGNDAKGVV